MEKEEAILTEQQYEVVRLIAESQEGAKVSAIAKQLEVSLQKVNGSIRGLSKKGIIEADEPGSHSPLYWLCDGVEIKDEHGKMRVFIEKPEGAGIEKGGEGEDRDFSTSEEFIRFKGLEGIDKLKHKELREWLQTYAVGRKARNLVLRQYETNPMVRYSRKGLYDSLRRAGVKEEHALGIVDQVFIIEEQYAPYLSDSDRDMLLYRKNPVATQRRDVTFFEGDPSSELGRHSGRDMSLDMDVGIRQGMHRGGERGSGTGVIDKETLRTVIREEIKGVIPQEEEFHSESINPMETPQDFEMVEEPILDEKGDPKCDSKGNIIYLKRYLRTDKSEIAEKEWRNKYEELKDLFANLEKRLGDSKMQSEIDFLKGKLEAIEKNPPGGITPELSVELKKIEQSANVLEKTLDSLTTLAKAHMGVPEEEGKRVALTDKELEELERKRAEEG